MATDLVQVVSDGMTLYGAAEVARMIVNAVRIKTNTAQFREHIDKELETYFEKVIPEIVAMVKQWEKPESLLGSDVVAILQGVKRVWDKTAEPKKRELLRRTLVNAFDQSLYDEGLTLRLLKIMEDMVYGDIYFLRVMLDLGGGLQVAMVNIKNQLPDPLLVRHHLQVLLDSDLVYSDDEPREARAKHYDNYQVSITELGKKMVQLTKER